jgi:hypothetical protein
MALFGEALVYREIEERVERVMKELRPIDDPIVVRIDHRIDTDFFGEPALFVDIVISEQITDRERLGRISRPVREAFRSGVFSEELGVHTYVHFVSESRANARHSRG